jgi:hypothetical protein
MVKTKTVYRPVVITNGKHRPLKDREFELDADGALQEAVRTDAEKFGKSEGYVLKVIQAERVKGGQ